MSLPTLGLIVPPAHGRVPRDGEMLYPGVFAFLAEGLGLAAMTLDGYDGVIDQTEGLAARLAARGADAIAFMGTSLTFYRGWQFHDELVERMKDASGLPATTMSLAVVDALRVLGIRRPAVATAYTDLVNERLRAFLEVAGFEIAALGGMAVEETGEAQEVPAAAISLVCDRVMDEARRNGEGDGGPDGLLISCGALQTLELVPFFESEYSVPVVSSSPAAFWSAARLLGHSGASPGFGTLFQKENDKAASETEDPRTQEAS